LSWPLYRLDELAAVEYAVLEQVADCGWVTAGAASFRGTVRTVMAGAQATGLVRNMEDPYRDHLVSPDGHDALIRFDVTDAGRATADAAPAGVSGGSRRR